MTISYTPLRMAFSGLFLLRQKTCCVHPFSMLVLLLLSLPGLAQPISLSALSPARNALSVASSTTVTVTLSQPPTGPASALTVWSQQAGGKKAGLATINGNALRLDPSTDFKPGEVVYVTTTTASGLAKPLVYQFTTEAATAPATFAGGSNVGVGSIPFSVAIGDVDVDGDLDLVSANSNSDNVSVLLNNGSGSFSSSASVAVGTQPYAVALGDVDGDGDLDLLTANSGSANVSVCLNNGSGSFSGATNFSGGGNSRNIVVGDVDGDGDLDILASTGNTISVLVNDGSGNFPTTTYVSVGSFPQSVVVGDVDGDGDVDLIAANSSSDNVSIRLNNGSGTFSGGSEVGVGDEPKNLAIGDVDGDGDLDLLTANQLSSTVSVRLNDGSGTFSGTTNLEVGLYPYSVAVGDVDGDGDLDLLTANYGNANVSVLLNNGSGSFSGSTTVGVGNAPRSVAMGDVDGDGDLDLVSANSNSNNVSVRLNQPLAAIIDSPASTTVCDGATTRFSVTASNTTAYQWQVSSGGAFTNLGNTSLYSGVTSAILTLTGATTALSGNQYRVVVSGVGSATSTAATLTVSAPPAGQILTPASSTLTCSTPSLALTATGGSSYHWENSTTNAVRSVNASGTYSVTVTGANGCTALATQPILSNMVLNIVAGSSLPQANVGVVVSLTASGATTYQWSGPGSASLSSPATGSAVSASLTTTGVQTFTVLGSSGVCSQSALVSVTALAGADLSPTLSLPNSNFSTGETKGLLVQVQEVNGSPSSGAIVITLTVPTGYSVSFDNSLTSLTVSGGGSSAVDNTKWHQTSSVAGQQLSVTINNGQSIGASTTMNLGFWVRRTSANSGSSSNITVNVTDDSGETYDVNRFNNVYARIISGL